LSIRPTSPAGRQRSALSATSGWIWCVVPCGSCCRSPSCWHWSSSGKACRRTCIRTCIQRPLKGANKSSRRDQSPHRKPSRRSAPAAKEAGNMVDLDSNPTKLLEIVGIGKQLAGHPREKAACFAGLDHVVHRRRSGHEVPTNSLERWRYAPTIDEATPAAGPPTTRAVWPERKARGNRGELDSSDAPGADARIERAVARRPARGGGTATRRAR
jgi:hypothetical protein